MTAQIQVNMTNWNNGETVTRLIDISVLSQPDYNASEGWECNAIVTDKAKQEVILSQWVSERACDQHQALLTLESWSIID